jgi:hypothetical protein
MSKPTNQLTGQEISDDKLKGISRLAEAQLHWEGVIAQLEASMEEANDQLRNLRENLLPAAMLEVGMSSFKLADGTSITVDTYYSAKIPDDREDDAFKWLRNTGNDALIKREVKCLFGKGEDEKATMITTLLVKAGVIPEDKSSVHPMTLKAFVREKIEAGEEFPQELFGVFVGNRAKLTPVKQST